MIEFYPNKWAMEQSALDSLVPRMMAVRDTSAKSLEKFREKRLAAGQAKLRKVGQGRIAALPVYGAVEHRASFMSMFFGGCSCEEIGMAIDYYSQDKNTDAIILDIDSPGGSSYGVQELSDKIYAARASKPIYAVANAMACSAAYWIGSAASHFSCTPSGDVGSIGVFAVHTDMSKAAENAGVKTTIIKAGKYKAEGNPMQPLSEETQAYIQSMVDATYTDFVKAVAKNRNCSVSDVREKFGQGRIVMADDAAKCGMVDRVATLEDVVSTIKGSVSKSDKAMVSTEVLRMRHERQKQISEKIYKHYLT